MKRDPLRRIEINPKVMVGKPVIRGTRITVEVILDRLAEGASVDEVLDDYPRLKKADVLAAIRYARDTIRNEEVLDRIRTAS